jgi:xanthine dehydrogenase iron-sulfur cluster and FAD-binding subunit A
MKWIGLAALIGFAGLLAWIRLAPDDTARWHALPEAVQDSDLEGGVMRTVPGDLAALDAIIRAEPRTHVLAGSVDSGMVTYVTRSRVFGFPDYTTVAQRGDALAIHARLRYGKSDMGVNKARVERWLAALRQG